MPVFVLPFYYIVWHYSRGIRDLLGIWGNFLWFVGNLFSVGTLLKTLIQPLKLMEEQKGSFISDPAQYAQNLLVNIIMRIVGMVTRLTLIIVALLAWALLLVGGIAGFVIWLALPVLLGYIFVSGITFLL